MQALDQAIDLAAAFEASTNPCMLLTPDLRYAGLNAAIGMTRDRLTGLQIFDIFTGGPTGAGAGNLRHDLAGEAKPGYASNGFIAEFSVPPDRDTHQHV